MIITRELAALVVYGEDSLLRALEKITANQARIVFCVAEHGQLIGSLTDGDFRRWLAANPTADLSTLYSRVAADDPGGP